MQEIAAKYGIADGIAHCEVYEDGSLKECMLNRRMELQTSCGLMIPQYEQDKVRRKYTKSLSFYSSGKLKSLSLNEQTRVKTPAGDFPAELITFYESGHIHRLFPLNGKISGFWTEENEYELAEEFNFSFPWGSFRKKIISIRFYENGGIKSLTFWPDDQVAIPTECGVIPVRTGISLYPGGSLKSVEPQKPSSVRTPIGTLEAFNPDILGLHGDSNSLEFRPDGPVRSLLCSTMKISITGKEGSKTVYRPSFKPNLFDLGKMDLVPLRIEFRDGGVRFGNSDKDFFLIQDYTFKAESIPLDFSGKCASCAGCTACG